MLPFCLLEEPLQVVGLEELCDRRALDQDGEGDDGERHVDDQGLVDSGTGLPSGSGDVPHEETLQSTAKTLGVALGVRRTRLDEAITVGQVIEIALAE